MSGFDADESLRKLRTEADTLAYLLEQFSADVDLLTVGSGKRIVYFIDSHDLATYFDPPRRLMQDRDGFVFDFERPRLLSRADAVVDMRLRHEQVMWRLLYGGEHVGILPYHGEEIDDEITHHHESWLRLRRGTPLLDQAHQQLQGLVRNREFKRELLSLQHSQGDPAVRRGVFHRLQAKAPALLAVLHPPPGSPMQRIDGLAAKGRLAASQEFPWENFGIDRKLAKELRELRPSPHLMSGWRRYLGDARGSASSRGNRIDGSAIAHLATLAERLQAEAPSVQLRLVTRAGRLINAARDVPALQRWNETSDVELRAALFLRHPRLVAQRPAPDARSREAEPAGVQSPEAALSIAIGTYRDQLPEMRAASSAKPDDSLLNAWEEFEKSLLAADLRLSDRLPLEKLTPEEEDTLRRLLSWFRSDHDITMLIIEQLMKTIRSFERNTFDMGQQRGTRTEAYLLPLRQPGRVRVIPSVTGTVGPLDLSFAGEASRKPVVLEHLEPPLGGNAPEEYLGRAFVLAAQGLPRLASIYAASAEHLARLTGTPPALGEARFLLSQLTRINSTGSPEAGSAWVDAAGTWLDSAGLDLDVRVHWERATQILEWQLSQERAAGTGPAFANGVSALRRALELPGCEDPLLPLRVLALAVAYYLVAERYPSLGASGQVSAGEARAWHLELHRRTEELRRDGQIDTRVISRFAQAVELIGFECLGDGSPDHGTGPGLMQIPAHLRPMAARLLDRMEPEAGSRRFSRLIEMVCGDLRAIVRKLRYKLERDLIYAPVWTDGVSAEVIRSIPDKDARRAAEDGYRRLERIAGGTVHYGVYPSDRPELDAIRHDFVEALRLGDGPGGAGSMPAATAFTLRMELYYVGLLLTKIELNPDQKERQLGDLEGSYRELCEAHPEEWMALFRLHVVLSEQRPPKQEEADALLLRAIELSLVPGKPRQHCPRDHWIHRTMRRRRALIHSRKAAEILRTATSADGTPAAVEDLPPAVRKSYLDLLVAAFDAVYEKGTGTFTDPPREQHVLFDLEARRTWNNVVFAGSRLKRLEGGDKLLAERRFDRQMFEKLLVKLTGARLEDVREPEIIHTIGYAYHTLGEHAKAHDAFLQLFAVVRDAGEEITGERVGDMLADAVGWKADLNRAGAVTGEPHSMQKTTLAGAGAA